LALWVGRLWETDDPYETLEAFWRSDPIAGAGLWLPAAVLHVRDFRRFQLWNKLLRQAYTRLDDSLPFARSTAEGYRLFNEGISALCDRYPVHPLEIPSLLEGLADSPEDSASTSLTGGAAFAGFCNDTFRF